jgi:hypothetical protein
MGNLKKKLYVIFCVQLWNTERHFIMKERVLVKKTSLQQLLIYILDNIVCNTELKILFNLYSYIDDTTFCIAT